MSLVPRSGTGQDACPFALKLLVKFPCAGFSSEAEEAWNTIGKVGRGRHFPHRMPQSGKKNPERKMNYSVNNFLNYCNNHFLSQYINNRIRNYIT